jgi:hypothetical protein
MIDLPDFPIIVRAFRINSKTIQKGLFKHLPLNSRQLLLSCLLLFSAVALSACSHGNLDYLKSGASDYTHYPEGGGLFIATAFGPDGRLWRVVPEKKHVYVDYSTNLGKTFIAPVLVNKESQAIKVSGENRPGIAVDHSGRITIIYAAEGVQPVTLYFSVSTDNGQSFSTPSPLSDKAAEANSFQGRLVLNPSGQAYVFWHDERNRTDWRQPGNAIYYMIIDGQSGLNFAARKLSDSICECCHIAAAFDKDDQAVVFARFIYPGGIRDHGLIKTQGNSKEPLSWRVTYDNWNIEACPEHGPAIAISDDGRYHIAWFTQGRVRQGLFHAYSSDRGQHFSSPVPLGNPEKLPGHPDIMVQGKRVILTWTEFDGVKSQLLVMQSNNGGQTWSQPKSIAGAAAETDYPFLLSNDQGNFVSWNSKTEGYRLIPLN